jgi:hypothetical protein
VAWEILTTLIQHGDQRGSRSTVLTSLGWMATLLVAGLIGSVSAHAPEWIQVFFAAMLGIDFFSFIIAYGYFALTNSESLRTEKFTLQKIAIEHGLIGDSTTGLFVPDTSNPNTVLTQVETPIEIENRR